MYKEDCTVIKHLGGEPVRNSSDQAPWRVASVELGNIILNISVEANKNHKDQTSKKGEEATEGEIVSFSTRRKKQQLLKDIKKYERRKGTDNDGIHPNSKQ